VNNGNTNWGYCRCTSKRSIEVAEESVPTEILVDQTKTCTANRGIPSGEYKSMQATSRGLDDFVVPGGAVWTVSKVTVGGYWMPTAPGDMQWSLTIFDREGIACRTGIKPVTLPGGVVELHFDFPCELIGGHMEINKDPMTKIETISPVSADETYWLTVAPVNNFASTNDIWYWSYSKTENGEVVKFRDMNNIWKQPNPCKTWTEANNCGISEPGEVFHDLCFSVTGSSSPMTDESWDIVTDRPKVPVKDSGIGTDVGHSRLLTIQEAEVRATTSDKLIVVHKANEATVIEEPVVVADISVQTSENPNPGYGIAAVTLGAIALALLIVVIAIVALKKNTEGERF